MTIHSMSSACMGSAAPGERLATGLFASKAVNAAGNDGLFFGNPGQLWTQFVTVVVTIVFAMVVTRLFLRFVKATMGLRVADDEERMGLDLSSA